MTAAVSNPGLMNGMSATAASCELSRSLDAAQSSLPWCSPQDAKLLQAWALFESKHGNMDRAVRLLQRAAKVDRAAIGALRWKVFRSYNQAHNPLARPSKRGAVPRRDRQIFDI